MVMANADGTLTEDGERILVRAFARACGAATVRVGETEQQADDSILAAARELAEAVADQPDALEQQQIRVLPAD